MRLIKNYKIYDYRVMSSTIHLYYGRIFHLFLVVDTYVYKYVCDIKIMITGRFFIIKSFIKRIKSHFSHYMRTDQLCY